MSIEKDLGKIFESKKRENLVAQSLQAFCMVLLAKQLKKVDNDINKLVESMTKVSDKMFKEKDAVPNLAHSAKLIEIAFGVDILAELQKETNQK